MAQTNGAVKLASKGKLLKMLMTEKGQWNSLGKATLGAAALTGLGLASKIRQIQNDTRRKAIIEDLSMNDPLLREANKQDLLTYYATIYNVAPRVSLDKNTVRDLLQNFVRFGRVDLQTIKTLADTEKSMTQGRTTFGITEMAKALF